MADIQPKPQGQLKRAKKQLRRHLNRLQNAGGLTAGQRDQLFADVLTDLTRIQLYALNLSNREDE